MFTVHFGVTVPNYLHEYEYVFVTGSDVKLGLWDPKLALRLEKNEDGRWTGSVSLSTVQIVNFRYFLGYYLESDVTKPSTLIISKWETHLRPRFVIPAVEARSGICRARVNDVFGTYSKLSCYYTNLGERVRVSEGWINDDLHHCIFLTISGKAFEFYKQRHVRHYYRLKVVPFDLRNPNDNFVPDDTASEDGTATAEEAEAPVLRSYSPTEFAPLTHGNDPRYKDQADFGEIFENGIDHFMYRTHSVSVESLGFRIEVYIDPTPACSDTERLKPRLFATAHALPSTLHDTFGKTSVPLLTQRGMPIGKLNFGYLFVRPLRKPHPVQKMEVSYAKHWKKRKVGFNVGHRGMGNSYTKFAVARENTIHSLNVAADNGADFVEFDVHLTKDQIPIIFHDFHVCVSVARRSPSVTERHFFDENGQTNGAPSDFHVLAVKDLKLQQLKLLHLDHVRHKIEEKVTQDGIIRVTGRHDEDLTMRPFPTLKEALEMVKSHVGFNIELKYPMLQLDGVHECENYFERNEVVDAILSDVLRHAGSRRIVFSSFDPDVCMLVSLKQNKYPVLFLCVGANTKHLPFSDERTRTSMTAVNFVAGTGLLGVNFHSEDLLKDPTPVFKAKNFGLVAFVWGDELIEKKTVDYFKNDLKVEGVIYDRIGSNGESQESRNIFLLEKSLKNAMFRQKPASPPLPTKRAYSLANLNLHSSIEWPILRESEKPSEFFSNGVSNRQGLPITKEA